MKIKIYKKIIHDGLAWIVAFIWIIPFLGLLMAAIRPMDELLHGWWNLETLNLTFKNFIGAWNHSNVPLNQGTINSLLIAVPATVIPVLIATMAGYGFSRYRFPTKRSIYILIILMLALPQQMIAVPIFSIINKLGLINNYFGLIIVHTAWGVPWITFFMRNFFTTLPVEVEEAAKIDGASDVRIFFKIALPIATPAIVSAVSLQFTMVWSDFFLALILMYSPEKLLATQRIPLMRGVYFVDWGLLSAASILLMLVPILVYTFFQKYYVKGMIGWSSK